MNKITEITPQQPVGGDGTAARFVGSIPAVYDTHLGPLLFHFSAADLAKRVGDALPDAKRVLEVACGTGISTEYLWRGLNSATEIIATDLNEAMLAYAEAKRGALNNVSYRQADAQALPFEDGSFDAVVCQFGIMFMPDKAQAFAEMARVLRPGGLLAFNVWDSFEHNRVAGLAREIIASFFDNNPPDFLTVPFGFYDIEPIRGLIAGAGFLEPEINTVSATVERPDAVSIARGFVEGNPGILQIRERGDVDPDTIIDALAREIGDLYGSGPLQVPLREIVCLARKP